MTEHKRHEGKRPAKILVIEDEPGILEIITTNLEAAGYQVIGVTNGLDGLRAFDTEHPDLVILDVLLPDISGFRLMELFRSSSRPRVPVMALTALDFAEAEELAEQGLDAFITKPFEPADLLSTIEFLLRRKGGPAAPAPGP